MKFFRKVRHAVKQVLQKKLAQIRSITKQDVKQFAKDCAPTAIYIGFYAMSGVAHASESVGITPLQKPLQVVTTALTGPIPILVTGGGIALGDMSWAMGWEQQAVMRGVKVAGGGAIDMAAGQFMSSTISDGKSVTGLLF